DDVVFDQRVAGAHPADTFDATIPNRVAAQDVRGPGLSRGPAICVPADRHAAAIRPFDRVVLEDPVVAARTRDHAELRKRIRIGGVLKADALDANEARATLRRNE